MKAPTPRLGDVPKAMRQWRTMVGGALMLCLGSPTASAANAPSAIADAAIFNKPRSVAVAYRDGDPPLARVEAIASHLASDEVVVRTTTGRVATTPEHPFFVAGKGWRRADALVAGDRLVVASKGASEVAVIIDVEHRTSAAHPVFNLEVERYHTYHVGSDRVLVHNGGKCVPKPATHELPLDKQDRAMMRNLEARVVEDRAEESLLKDARARAVVTARRERAEQRLARVEKAFREEDEARQAERYSAMQKAQARTTKALKDAAANKAYVVNPDGSVHLGTLESKRDFANPEGWRDGLYLSQNHEPIPLRPDGSNRHQLRIETPAQPLTWAEAAAYYGGAAVLAPPALVGAGFVGMLAAPVLLPYAVVFGAPHVIGPVVRTGHRVANEVIEAALRIWYSRGRSWDRPNPPPRP